MFGEEGLITLFNVKKEMAMIPQKALLLTPFATFSKFFEIIGKNYYFWPYSVKYSTFLVLMFWHASLAYVKRVLIKEKCSLIDHTRDFWPFLATLWTKMTIMTTFWLNSTCFTIYHLPWRNNHWFKFVFVIIESIFSIVFTIITVIFILLITINTIVVIRVIFISICGR